MQSVTGYLRVTQANTTPETPTANSQEETSENYFNEILMVLDRVDKNSGRALQAYNILDHATTSLKGIRGELENLKSMANYGSKGNLSEDQRSTLASDMAEALSGITEMASATQSRGNQLLDGSFSRTIFVVGNNPNQDRITIALNEFSSTSLGLKNTNVDDVGNAITAYNQISRALTVVNRSIKSIENKISDMKVMVERHSSQKALKFGEIQQLSYEIDNYGNANPETTSTRLSVYV